MSEWKGRKINLKENRFSPTHTHSHDIIEIVWILNLSTPQDLCRWKGQKEKGSILRLMAWDGIESAVKKGIERVSTLFYSFKFTSKAKWRRKGEIKNVLFPLHFCYEERERKGRRMEENIIMRRCFFGVFHHSLDNTT